MVAVKFFDLWKLTTMYSLCDEINKGYSIVRVLHTSLEIQIVL